MTGAAIADEAGRAAAVLIVLLLPLVRLAVGGRRGPRPSLSSHSQKESLMSDLPNATAAVAASDVAPIATAPAVAGVDAPAPAIDPNKVVASVVQTVQAQPESVIHPSKVAGVIASILGGLYQAEPAIFAVAKAGAQTQAEVSLGLGLAEVIVGAFLHPAS